ncbi:MULTISPECIES: NfeD family protein [Parabacteroides]|uniref:NfeD-like C-terminal, partner-binding n=1 Tax=Parabacteroides chinchillae TaxID=871327 RepID=A0A8G2BYN8_9BACT|nr:MULTISPECIES: NfeD family protein [Parabacteroides]SEG21978.1 NfeD-like C-terminal, partner-binding [Parabacteroides chinchillae]
MILDIAIIAFLLIVAIVLILLEIFFLPGITLAGIGGFIFAAGGIIFAYSAGTMIGHISLIASILVFGIAFVWLMRSNSFSRVALKTDINSKLTSSRDLGIQPGDEGITLSRLAPIGKARINGINVEAKSEEELLDENTPVIVVRVDSYNVIVKPKDEQN